ncbi:MAG TPA: tetratricopeptide repeat protein, partial [Bacteroidota bacterium]|nr:tetratricopeptide repeat protein [Bacteroidota bacterium]
LIDKKYEDAEKNLKKSIETNDQDANALLWYAQTLHSAGKKDEACKWYQRVLKLDKDNKDAKKGMDMIPCQ